MESVSMGGTSFQRVGSISNAHVGRDFEAVASAVLGKAGIVAPGPLSLNIGVGSVKKAHTFDLGSRQPPVVVECKSHRWTAGGNVPSAKMTVWNEAMYYFAITAPEFRRILFVLHDHSAARGMTLAQYYKSHYAHLIPAGVEIWEFDPASDSVRIF